MSSPSLCVLSAGRRHSRRLGREQVQEGGPLVTAGVPSQPGTVHSCSLQLLELGGTFGGRWGEGACVLPLLLSLTPHTVTPYSPQLSGGRSSPRICHIPSSAGDSGSKGEWVSPLVPGDITSRANPAGERE